MERGGGCCRSRPARLGIVRLAWLAVAFATSAAGHLHTRTLFDAATNSYTHCVDATIERIASQHPGASHDDLHSLKEFGTVAHNTAIDQETAVADQLNAQVRSYKAKHPQS